LDAVPTASLHWGQRFCPRPKTPGARADFFPGPTAPGARAGGAESTALASAGTALLRAGGAESTGLASAGTALLLRCTRQHGLPCRHPGHRVWPGTLPHLRLVGFVAMVARHFCACMHARMTSAHFHDIKRLLSIRSNLYLETICAGK